jgi:aspartate/methionine/tyrosine aminotransferase
LAIDVQAEELNKKIISINPVVFDLLSQKGINIFFPTKGIPVQSAEAKGKEIDATIGMAVEDNGDPFALDSISSNISLSKKEVFTYASSYGNKELREIWKKMICEKNPSLNSEISLPVVTGALTHALSICGFLFVNENDSILVPDLFWGNYKLIFQNWFLGKIQTHTTFEGNSFNLKSFEEKLNSTSGKKIVLLNFPNNPTGYTLTENESRELVSILKRDAEKGNKLVVLIDDAYFGLVYKDGIIRESLFASFANLHENLLAVKIDGATKEDYVWGFRVGFLTFGIKGGTKELYSALEAKTAGAIRGNVSNLPQLSQSLLLKAYSSPDYKKQKQEKFLLLKERFMEVEKVLQDTKYLECFEALPSNSGYFMCVKLKKPLEAEKVRKILLSDYSTGVIALGDLIRVAFSSVKKSDMKKLFDNIFEACKKSQSL